MDFVYRYQRSFEEFVRRNTGLILLLGSFFVIGVIFGGLAVRSVSTRDRTEIATYLTDTLERVVHPEKSDSWLIFKRSLLRSAKQLGLLWALGITLLALPVALVGALVLGLASGFTVSFLTAEMGWGGLALALAGLVAHSLLVIPALLFAATSASRFSLQLIRSWRERRRVPNFYPAFARFTGALLATWAVLMVSGLVEAYVSPQLAKLAASLLHLS